MCVCLCMRRRVLRRCVRALCVSVCFRFLWFCGRGHSIASGSLFSCVVGSSPFFAQAFVQEARHGPACNCCVSCRWPSLWRCRRQAGCVRNAGLERPRLLRSTSQHFSVSLGVLQKGDVQQITMLRVRPSDQRHTPSSWRRLRGLLAEWGWS